MLQFSVPGEKNCGFTAKLFSVPDSTCVPSSQSLQVVHCIRVIAGKIAVFIAAARCTTQSPLLEGRYFPIDQRALRGATGGGDKHCDFSSYDTNAVDYLEK